MEKAVIFGAGSIGRGFIGQLFSESGYHVTFVDIDHELLSVLNRQNYYKIQLVTSKASQTAEVGPVQGLIASDTEAVARAVAEASIGATAVGAGVLKDVAAALAVGIARRAEQEIDTPLNLIICENLKDAAALFKGMVEVNLPLPYHRYLNETVGFVDTVIARMIPRLPKQVRADEPAFIVAEPYKILPVDAAGFIGAPPRIAGMQPVAPFSFYTERKLYIHNAGHAVLGYLGYQRGYTYGFEALDNVEIAQAVRGAMAESQRALEKKYDLSDGDLTTFVDDLIERFNNEALADPVFRLARDPIRKLGYSDRLVGAARNALEQQVEPSYLVEGIVAALQFDQPEDPIAIQLQNQLKQLGLVGVLQKICGLASDSPLARLIQQRFYR